MKQKRFLQFDLPRVLLILSVTSLWSCGMYGVPNETPLRHPIADEQGPEAFTDYVLTRTTAKDILYGLRVLINRTMYTNDDPALLMDGYVRIFEQLDRGWPGFHPKGISIRLEDGTLAKGYENPPESLYPRFYEQVYRIGFITLSRRSTREDAPAVLRETYLKLEPDPSLTERHAEWRRWGEKYRVFDP